MCSTEETPFHWYWKYITVILRMGLQQRQDVWKLKQERFELALSGRFNDTGIFGEIRGPNFTTKFLKKVFGNSWGTMLEIFFEDYRRREGCKNLHLMGGAGI